MKKLKQIFLLVSISILSFTCADHVDYEPIEGYAITADVYFQNESDYEAALIGTYDVLQWLYLNSLIGDIASDNSLCGGESATDVIGLQQIDDMTHYPNNDNLRSIWQWL